MAAPPTWFLAAVDELARLGLPELDDDRRDNLWGSWEERWSPDPPAASSTTLARALSLYPGCVWTCGSLRATPQAACFRGWLEQLAAISHGALTIADVQETWSGTVTVKVRFSASGGWFELFPRHIHGRALLRELLDAASAAADRAVFHELVVDRPGGARADADEDDCGAPIVCLPRAAARKLQAAGVRFVEWSPPARPPRRRVTRWLEKAGLVRRPPVLVPPDTQIRRIDAPPAAPSATAPAAGTASPGAPIAPIPRTDEAPAPVASARRGDGPLLSEIVAGAADRIGRTLAPHGRPTWAPITEAGESAAHASQFGGAPWLAERQRAPRCASCDRPMVLAVQLDLAALPPELRATGLLQCFVCLEDDQTRAHVIDPARAAPPARRAAGGLPARAIIGWTPQGRELPGPAHWDELGLSLDAAASAVAEDEIDDVAEGDKLGGWPAYIQEPSLGPCARCGQPRVLLLQVASDDNLAVHFGDEGRLFVATCPDHPTAVEARIEYH